MFCSSFLTIKTSCYSFSHVWTFLVEYICFWKISACSILCSLIKIIFFSFPVFFFFFLIWHFVVYYIPCLHVHAPWHYTALTWRLGNQDTTGFRGLASMRLHGVSQEISGIYYIRRNLLKTTLRKESEEILLLASKTDVHIYIYRKWNSRQTRWFAWYCSFEPGMY